jgi:hypothetical protein
MICRPSDDSRPNDSNNMARKIQRLAAMLAILAGAALPVVAQPPPTAPAAARTVRFAWRPTCVGDQVEQTITLDMRLSTTWRQGNEVTEQTLVTTRQRQRRSVATTEIAGGRARAVVVRYLEATRQVNSLDAKPPADAVAEQPAEPPAAQPVAGKSYRCRRAGDKLIVTDAQGNGPPPDEAEIVAADLEALGRPNPLVEILAGRTVAVGETLALPMDVADRLLGIGDEFGALVRFDLTLRDVRTEEGATYAEFQARIAAASHDAPQVRLELGGPLVVQVDTCRAVRMEFAGPLGLSESRSGVPAAYHIFGAGKLSLSIASTYHDAPR